MKLGRGVYIAKERARSFRLLLDKCGVRKRKDGTIRLAEVHKMFLNESS